MANYDSPYSGAQVDESVGKILGGLKHDDADQPDRNAVGAHDASAISLVLSGEDLLNEAAMVKFNKTVTLLIPTHFPDWQAAFDYIGGSISTFNHEIELRFEAGHQITNGLRLNGGDYSSIRITSDDAIVTLDAGFVGADTSGIPVGILGETPRQPLMCGYGTKLPKLACLIDMDGLHGMGIQMAECVSIVELDCGVINAGFRGIQIHGRANIYGANFNGAKGSGIRLQQASSCDARNATADNCCSTEDLVNSAVYVSRSSNCEFRGGSAQNSGASGIISRRSKITADDANVDGASRYGALSESCGEISFGGGSALNCGFGAVRGASRGTVSAPSTQLSSVSPTVTVDRGGVVILDSNCTIDGQSATESVVIANSNVAYTNAFDPDGMVFFQDGNGTFKVTSNANGISQRFADGRMITFASGSIDTGAISSGSFSSNLTMPTQPDTFVSVDTSHMTVVGRGNIGGGGTRICVDNYYRGANVTGNEWKFRNTGQQLDGAATAVTVNAINFVLTSFGTWR